MIKIFIIYYLLTGLIWGKLLINNAKTDNQFVFYMITGFLVGFIAIPYKYILGLIEYIEEINN